MASTTKKSTEIALSETLGIDFEIEAENDPVLVPVSVPAPLSAGSNEAEAEANEDYELARSTLRELIREGKNVLEEMKHFAREAESPRAFEVYSTMIKTLSDTTGTLVDLHKKKKELKEPTSARGAPSVEGINVEKAVFVGSTADLLKKVKGPKE